MKKSTIYSISLGGFTLLATASLAIAGSGEDVRLVMPRSVQGTDYASTLRGAQSEGIRKMSATPAFEWVVPDDIGMPDGQFTFDDIDNWTGDGENRAALVIQWNDDDEQTAMVFGYRWDGMATGADMLKAVVEANPRLYTLMQYTNVSSPTDPDGGYTICGLGWDRDNDGDIRLIDTENNEEYTSESGFFRHPRSYDPINDYGGTSDYDYDNWKACDDDDFWGGGWYENYWSYWVKSGDGETFSYSNWGASGRVLENDCWDGWKYAKNMNSQGAWKPFVTAPNLNANPDDLIWEEDNLVYRVTNVTLHSVALCSPAALGKEAYSGDLVIPSTITHDGEEYRVTGVDDRACQDAEIRAVTLPGGIRSIGNYAFAGSNVESITAADYDDTFHIVPSIISIGEGAFKDCAALSTYIIGNNKIAPHTYAGTAITEIVVPTAATSLTSDMFAGCKDVKNVRVYSSVPLSIAEDLFEPAVYSEATLLVPEDGLEAYKNDAVWSKFTNIGTTSAPLNVGDQFCYNKIYYKVTSTEPGNLTVEVQPASWDGIQWPGGWYDKTCYANEKKYYGELTVPELVPYKDLEFVPTSVADFAFHGIQNVRDEKWNVIAQTVVTVPSSIKKAGQRAFMSCPNLTSIPAELEEIGESAFEWANILGSTFPTGLRNVGNRAFMNAKIQNEVALDLSQATKIGDYGFYHFEGLQLVKFGPVMPIIGESALRDCYDLTEVILDENLVEIPANAFKGMASIQSVKLSDNVTSIGNEAFYNCTNLRYLNYYETPDSYNSDGAQKLPSTLRMLGDHAFFMCPITFQSFPETLEYLGEGNYLDAKNIVLDASVTEISDEMFKDMTQIKSITLSDKVTYIGENAFYGCSNLEFINILEDPDNWNKEGAQPLPESLNTIGDWAFYGCEKLNISSLPEGVTYLGGNVFYENPAITEFRIPSGVASIPASMFRGCSNLKTITLSNGVEEIGNQVFYGCPNLEFINILEDPENWNKEGAQPLPVSLTTIGQSAFEGCSSLNLDILPENLREIGTKAFYYMDAVECLQFPEGITNLYRCIDRTDNLKRVVVPSTCEAGDFLNFGSRLLSVYLCGMEPSFDLIITRGDEVIGRVIVPTGSKEAYINGNGYADYNPETPVITDVILDSPVADCGMVKADYEVTYKEELPLLFAVANRKALAANAEVTFEVYTVSDEMVSREEVEPVAKGAGWFNENGLLEAEMPSALPTGKYRIRWTISADGNTVKTPMEEFAYAGTVKVDGIGSDATTISAENGMICFKGMAGREFVVFDMTGKNIASFTVQSDDFTLPLRVETGIYMIVSRDAKIATKVKL